MNIANGLIVGINLANKIMEKETYIIDNSFKYPDYPKVEITNYSNKNFIGQKGELIHKGKKYSIIRLYLDKASILRDNNIPWNINPIYRVKNDCFKIIDIKQENSKELQ